MRSLYSMMRLVVLMSMLLLMVGCGRGRYSEKTPIHPNPNMDSQDKYKAQSESNFFVDGASMRTPVEGTVARGELRADDAYYRGRDTDGELLDKAPMVFTPDMVTRGAERYQIYCSACHGVNADGKGKILYYNYPIPPADFMSERIRNLSDGHMFNAVTAGWLNMPNLSAQVSVADRWAIISYIRSLQQK